MSSRDINWMSVMQKRYRSNRTHLRSY